MRKETSDDGGATFDELLRCYRRQCGFTQDELAERSGLSDRAIRKLEHGGTRPQTNTVAVLAGALGLDASERALFTRAAREGPALAAASSPEGPASPVAGESMELLARAQSLLAAIPLDVVPPHAPLPAGSRMPLAPNPLFVGRGDELLHVARALRGGDTTVALGQVIASTGLGGLGKTQLAVELVHRYGRYFAGGVFWLSFASADEIPLQVADCAAPGLESRSVDERSRRVRDGWQSAVPRLLVFDNCEEETLLEAWRPPSGGCRVLVTSRRSSWSPTLGVTALPLDLLPRPDSVELLRRYLPDVVADGPGLAAIAAELGDLPLALHLAGSYLRAYRAEVGLDSYLAELRRPSIIHHASLLGAGLDHSPSPTHHVQSVAQTFALSLGRLAAECEVDRVAIALLDRMACMAPGEPVPRDLLARTMDGVDPIRRADGLRRLESGGLVQDGDGWLRMHRLLVRFVRQERLDTDARRAVDRALVRCGEDASLHSLTGAALAAVIPHVVDVAAAAGGTTDDELRAAELSTAAGRMLHHAGDLTSAGQWYERALAIRERRLGSEHLDTATSLHGLGGLLGDQGDLSAATRCNERALAIRERVLGPDHPDTVEVLHDMGLLLRGRGDLAAARAMLERVLATRERVQGPDHPDTATTLQGLGLLLLDLGELAAARAVLERALAINEHRRGPDSPHIAANLNNLALVLRAQGDLAAARALYERTVAMCERVLGPDHPNTAFGLGNLATVMRAQGDLPAARVLYERALAIRERALGPDHPDTALSLNGLALLLRTQGAEDAARPLCERGLAIRERALGRDHPLTAQSLNDLAALLRDQGDPAAARPLFERALAIRERVLGHDHPDTVATRHALAELAAEGEGPATEG